MPTFQCLTVWSWMTQQCNFLVNVQAGYLIFLLTCETRLRLSNFSATVSIKICLPLSSATKLDSFLQTSLQISAVIFEKWLAGFDLASLKLTVWNQWNYKLVIAFSLLSCKFDDRVSLNFHRFVISYIMGHTTCGHWSLTITNVIT